MNADIPNEQPTRSPARLTSCVTPQGSFLYGIHKPTYAVSNMRPATRLVSLGVDDQNNQVVNNVNFPDDDVEVAAADWIYEIPNPFPFRGRTYINKVWADNSAANPARISLPNPPEVSLSRLLAGNSLSEELIDQLPRPLKIALATTSTDPDDLVRLAHQSCEFAGTDPDNYTAPLGLVYITDSSNRRRAAIRDLALFEAVANNPSLPDAYKIAMVIRPGAQGNSEIVGEWETDDSHIYEYLRRNSYISGGHYAANMAEDGIRYSIHRLSREDMRGLRHLYYQRSFLRLAKRCGLDLPPSGQRLSQPQLEELRTRILANIAKLGSSPATLWGWNFGFDFAPTLYRLHASHQQIHQQYALIEETLDGYNQGDSEPVDRLAAYGCGDMIGDWILEYHQRSGQDFFTDYRQAIESNQRMDGRDDLPRSLEIYRDEYISLFVPKAQTSQWEVQLMTLPDKDGRLPGNILECSKETREAIDNGLLLAQKALAGLGARMVTSIEYPKRLGTEGVEGQPLLYALLPRLPESPGAFSEAQLRFINGHYPEDFAEVCRRQLAVL